MSKKQCRQALTAARTGNVPALREAAKPLSADELTEIGEELEAERSFGAAEVVYRLLIEREPQEPDHWTNLGFNLYYHQRRAAEADAFYDDAIRRFPDQPHLKVTRGLNLTWGLGRHDQALRWLSEAVDDDPTSSWHRGCLAWCLLGMGRRTAGVRQCRLALRCLKSREHAERLEYLTFLFLGAEGRERHEALRAIRRDIDAGHRATDGDFDSPLAQAVGTSASEGEWFRKLTQVVRSEAPAEVLTAWSAWRTAAAREDAHISSAEGTASNKNGEEQAPVEKAPAREIDPGMSQPGVQVTDFDWTKLTHVYGSAEDVPDLYEAVLQEDEDASNEATNELISRLYHQEDVTDATAALILVIGEELRAPAHARRPAVLLDLLTLFAEAATSFDPNEQDGEMALAKVLRSEPLQGEFGSMNTKEAADAVAAALRRVSPRAIEFLTDENHSASAAAFLARSGAADATLKKHVMDALDRAPDDENSRAALLAALAATDPTCSDEVTRRLQAALLDETLAVRRVACIELVRRLGPACSPEVLDILTRMNWESLPKFSALKTPEEVADHLESHGTEFLLSVLSNARSFEDAVEVLAILAARVTKRFQRRGSSRSRAPDGTVRIQFVGTPQAPTALLTRDEHRLWRTAVDATALWQGQTNLFALVGVPSERTELEHLAAPK